jgi:hypothetical protein
MGVPRERLKAVFGSKSGENLFNLCRGIDRNQLKLDQSKDRKSVSVEVNYGIRFTEWAELESFLKELSNETVKRMKEASAKAKNISVKLKIKSKDAPKETAKFLGHGICDNVSRTTLLPTHTDTLSTISRAVINLVKSFKNLSVADVRGIGIQATKLYFNDIEAHNGDSSNKSPDTLKPASIEELFARNSSRNPTNSISTHDVFQWHDVDVKVLEVLPHDIQNEIRQSFGQNPTSVNSLTNAGLLKKPSGKKTTSKSKTKDTEKQRPTNSSGLLEKMFTRANEQNDSDIDRRVKQIMKQRSKVCGLEDLCAITDILREWVTTEPVIQDEDVAYITKCFMNFCYESQWTVVKALVESFHDSILEKDRVNDEESMSSPPSTSSWTDVYNTIIQIIRSELEDSELITQPSSENIPSTSSFANKLMQMEELKTALCELRPP